MAVFERLDNGQILFINNAGVISHVIPHGSHLHIDPRNDDIIIIDSDPGPSREFQQFEFKASEVTFPTHTGRDDLIRQLATNFLSIGTRNLPLGISIFDFNTGAINLVDNNGALKVGQARILNGDVFGGVIPSSNLWNFGGNGNNITQAGNERIETGTTADGFRQFQSIKRARFMGSQFNIFHSGINLPQLTNPDVIFRFGAFNPIGTSNGAYFEVEGGPSPSWYVVTVKNGIATRVPQTSWTGKGAATFSATPGLAVYEIIYNAGQVNFKQGVTVIHTQSVGKLGETYANSYHFNVGAEVRNINGNTTNNGIELYAMVIYRHGEERGELIPRTYTASTLIKTGAGYVGKVNLSRTGSSGGAGTVEVYDGTDATGIRIGHIDVGGDDTKGIILDGTFSDGLFIDITGPGVNVVTINYE